MHIDNTAAETDKPQPAAKDEIPEETPQDSPVGDLPTINESPEIAEKEEIILSTIEHQVTRSLLVEQTPVVALLFFIYFLVS